LNREKSKIIGVSGEHRSHIINIVTHPTIFDKILQEYKSEKEKARAQIDKYLAGIIDPKKELGEIEDLKQTKGEEFLREEIRNFILKHRIY